VRPVADVGVCGGGVGVSSTASTTGLSGMARRMRFDGERRAVALYGAVAVSMAGLARVFASIYTPEMGWRKMAKAASLACAGGSLSRFGR
jgi:hypothetical protein